MISKHELEYMLENTDGFGAGTARKMIRGHRFWTAGDEMSIVKPSENEFLVRPQIRNTRSKCEWRYDLKTRA